MSSTYHGLKFPRRTLKISIIIAGMTCIVMWPNKNMTIQLVMKTFGYQMLLKLGSSLAHGITPLYMRFNVTGFTFPEA